MLPQTTRTFRVFVSSTFADLEAERNALQDRVFPALRALCARHGCRFQAIDLRWGVRDEASLDQQTLRICLEEIARCQRVTPRPNFLILLGDRYGWRPLPYEISAAEFVGLRKRVAEGEQRQLIDSWYCLDTNSIPAVYVLQPRTGSFAAPADWEPVESRLRTILQAAAAALELPPDQRFKYQASATEQEVMAGVLAVPDAHEHVFAFFRNIEPLAPLPGFPAAGTFVDLDEQGCLDWAAHFRVRALKERLEAHLTRDQVCSYTVNWNPVPPLAERELGERDGWSPVTLAHLDRFCRDVFLRLARMIRRQIALLETADPLEAELNTHARFGAERARHFVGRRDALKTIAHYLETDDRQPLVITGEGGCGKTALLARAAGLAAAAQPGAVVMVRYLGSTAASSDGRSLLEGLSRELSHRYRDTVTRLPPDWEALLEGLPAQLEQASSNNPVRLYAKTPSPFPPGSDEFDELLREHRRRRDVDETNLPADFEGLVSGFPDRLALATAERPLFLFLDAYDQLLAADPDRAGSWIPARLPEHVRLVVSTLPGEALALLEGRVEPRNVLRLEALSREEGEALLDGWLQVADRTLQPEQREAVLAPFSVNPLPLYLKLAFEEARRWRSSHPPEVLPPSVREMARCLFRRLAGDHGPLLVSRSLGYLAAARHGLSEDELLELLARDRVFFRDFLAHAYHKLSAAALEQRQLPVVVWSRLYFDLEPYLTERRTNGISLFTFYHRILEETAAEEFLAGDERKRRHRALARYFGCQANWLQWPVLPNPRKASELPYHLAQATWWRAQGRTLRDPEIVGARCMAGLTHDLLADYGSIERIPGAAFPGLRQIAGAMRLSGAVVAGEPRQLAGQLHARLLGARDGDIDAFLAGLARLAPRPWLRPLQPCLAPPGGPLLLTIPAWGGTVLMPDGKRLVTACGDEAKVWDLETGELLHSLTLPYERRHGGGLTPRAVTPDGRRVVLASGRGTLWIWEPESSRICVLSGHSARVTSVAVSQDGKIAVSGSEDRTLWLWDLEMGRGVRPLKGHTDWILGVEVTSDGRWAISASKDHTLKVWDLDPATGLRALARLLGLGPRVRTLRGHTRGVRDVALTLDGKRAVSASEDATLGLWDLKAGVELRTLTGHSGSVYYVAVTPDGKRAVSKSSEAIFWNLETGQEMFRVHGASQVKVSSDGERVVAIGGSQVPHRQPGLAALKVWDLESGREICAITVSWGDMKVTPDGKRAVIAFGGRVRVWDIEKHPEARPLPGHARPVIALAVTPDGQQALSAAADATLKAWDLATGTELRTCTGHGSYFHRAAMTPDGSRVVLDARDGTLKVWEPQAGPALRPLQERAGRIEALAVTPDGKRAVGYAYEQGLWVWDLDSGAPLRALSSAAARDLVVLPDGKSVTAALESAVMIWDLESGALLRTFVEREGLLTRVAVTPDGSRLVSAANDGKLGALKVWDLESGALLRTLQGLTGRFTAIAVAPDGGRVVSASQDQTLTAWDTAREERLATFTVEADITCCVIGPDGGTIVAGDQSGRIHFWRLEE